MLIRFIFVGQNLVHAVALPLGSVYKSKFLVIAIKGTVA
jgi:hypothetical protein